MRRLQLAQVADSSTPMVDQKVNELGSIPRRQ
jgi:hypothetical protein